MNDQEKELVDVIVHVGGDLPESKLETFINKALRLFLHSRHEFTYKITYQARIREEIREQIAIALKKETYITLKVVALDGEIDQDFVMECVYNNLLANVETTPFISVNGNYMNNALWLVGRNLSSTTIPLDGEGNATTLVDDVFDVVDDIFNELEKPEKNLPLLINESGITKEIARRRLAGESLRKILTEVLRSRIDYPDRSLPPFTIIKGK